MGASEGLSRLRVEARRVLSAQALPHMLALEGLEGLEGVRVGLHVDLTAWIAVEGSPDDVALEGLHHDMDDLMGRVTARLTRHIEGARLSGGLVEHLQAYEEVEVDVQKWVHIPRVRHMITLKDTDRLKEGEPVRVIDEGSAEDISGALKLRARLELRPHLRDHRLRDPLELDDDLRGRGGGLLGGVLLGGGRSEGGGGNGCGRGGLWLVAHGSVLRG
jgi:hypothetical protein